MSYSIENLSKKFMGLLVGIIIVMVVLIPITSDLQKSVGDEITYNNDLESTNRYGIVKDGEYTYNSEGWYFNGEKISDMVNAPLIESDKIYVGGYSGTTLFTFAVYSATSASYRSSSTPLTMIISGNTCTISTTSEVLYSGEFDWMYVKSADGPYCFKQGSADAYANSINDFVYCGIYTTGENNTYYYAIDGQAHSTQYENAELNNGLVLVDGTTDIYKGHNTITIDGETFTPFWWLVKEEINGHEASGTNYTILGVIPVFVLLGIVLAITRSFMPGSKEESSER